MDANYKRAWAVAVTMAALVLAGCGLPGAPLPPTLNLPNRVTDLSAARAGDRVSLHWTMPTHNTDKMLLTNGVDVSVCRKESAAGDCVTAGTLQLAPGAIAAFTEDLPASLAEGPSHPLIYFVELKNNRGRSAGLSNGATVLAGKAPPALTGLTAEMAKDGVILRWKPLAAAQEHSTTAVRLQRTLITPAVVKPKEGLLTPSPEPAAQNLLIPAGVAPGRALDKDIRFGETYEYRAQRVTRSTVGDETLELAGALSAPVRIHAVNVFPPAVPTALVAVATPAENGSPLSIDLSWQPDAEADVAGYVVYRREEGTAWQRISPAQPVVGPAFRDEQVEPGHTYDYAVSAVGHDGLESARSAEAQERVPSQ
jgi:hypothetical protein